MLISPLSHWPGRAILAGAALTVGLTMLPGRARASGPVGLEVLVQAWNPADPHTTEHPKSVFKNATLFSDSMGQAWEAARGPACDAMKQQLGKADLLKKGFTLYDMACSMGHIDSLTLGQKAYGSNEVQLNLVIGGNDFEATSTQPTVCGKECDARVSVHYTVTLATTLQMYPFKVVAGSATVSDVQLDPHNAVAGVAAALDEFFTKGHYKSLAEHALSVTQALPIEAINSKLANIQNPLQPYVATYATIGTWAHNGLLTVDMATKPIPNPSGGSISGVITWAKSAPVTLNDCNSFSLAGAWQNGPAPLVAPPDTLGSEPSVPVGQLSMMHVVDRGDHYECSYSMAALPLHLPMHVQGTVAAGKGTPTNNSHTFVLVSLQPTAWGGNVTPNPFGGGFDFKVVASTVQSKPFGSLEQMAKNTGDPMKASVAESAAQQSAAPAVAQQKAAAPAVTQQKTATAVMQHKAAPAAVSQGALAR